MVEAAKDGRFNDAVLEQSYSISTDHVLGAAVVKKQEDTEEAPKRAARLPRGRPPVPKVRMPRP